MTIKISYLNYLFLNLELHIFKLILIKSISVFSLLFPYIIQQYLIIKTVELSFQDEKGESF